MAASFFFYDLETSSLSPFEGRIMQFAGQRTGMDLEPIGEPVNILVKLTGDILPDPDAVFVTGITPQAVNADGVTEADFLRTFADEIATPGTIFVGYNTIRFDDEFVRNLHYRNFYDPYEWQWQDSRSKWDLLDVVRMTRALRPEGIAWPIDAKGKPTNRLELLTALNKLSHKHAHDALSDVKATISIAKLIHDKQTKLFDFLLSMRDKRKVIEMANSGQPFVYASGRYAAEFEKNTVVATNCDHPKKQGALVYDLRYDPSEYRDMTAEQLAGLWRWTKDPEAARLPIKCMQYNRCPAIAPLGVLDVASQKRLKLDMAAIKKNFATLQTISGLRKRLCDALEILEAERPVVQKTADSSIYEGFFGPQDKQSMRRVRAAKPEDLGDLGVQFEDHRLEELLPLYKARNFPQKLTSEEYVAWDEFRRHKLLDGGQQSSMAKFFTRLQELAQQEGLTEHQQYLLGELQLYAESIMPVSGDE